MYLHYGQTLNKGRCQIEVSFKAIKQNLKVKRFYGDSKNVCLVTHCCILTGRKNVA
jgi:IS4 transposase